MNADGGGGASPARGQRLACVVKALPVSSTLHQDMSGICGLMTQDEQGQNRDMRFISNIQLGGWVCPT